MPDHDDHITDDQRPPERRRDERPDEDYEGGPRRYDDLDLTRPPPGELSWMDKQFLDSSVPLVVLFALCCGGIAFGFGLAGVIVCQHPDARQKAWILTIISGLGVALALVWTFLNELKM
jgi:hypothetical protein